MFLLWQVVIATCRRHVPALWRLSGEFIIIIDLLWGSYWWGGHQAARSCFTRVLAWCFAWCGIFDAYVFFWVGWLYSLKKWVLIGFNGLNRCFSSINRPLLTQSRPKRTQTLWPHQTSENSLTCWLDLGAKKKALILTNRGLLNFMNRICIEKCNIISLFRCKFNHSFCFQQIFFEKKCVKW